MLRLEFLNTPMDREKYLDNYLKDFSSPQNLGSTWIVSDLKLKFEIQERIIEQQEFFEDFSVLRVSELWNHLAKRKFPEIFWTSPEWVQSWLKTQLSLDEELNLGPQSFKTVFEAMNLFYPVILSEGGRERMDGAFASEQFVERASASEQFKEWLRDNPASLAHWGGWYLLAEKYILELLKQKKLCRYWIQGLLQNKNDWGQVWDRPFIFDLGMQISMIEAEIIQQLSNSFDVTVLIPLTAQREQYKYLYKPYDFLLKGRPYPSLAKEAAAPIPQARRSRIRVPGILSEIKWSVNQIRQWIEAGVSASNIMIAAPDIEQYWPILQPLLAAEGIPVSKSKVIRLSSLPKAYSWIARLKVNSGQISYDQLELATYHGLKQPPRFEKFFAMFSEILGIEDLSRNPEIEKSFASRFKSNDLLTRDEFFGYSASLFELSSADAWDMSQQTSSTHSNQFEVIEWAFKEIYTHSREKDTLKLSDWIFWLERILSRKEKLIQPGQEDGLHLTNISAADSLGYPYRIYLGLSENLLKKTHRASLLSGEEVGKINSDIGFYFEDPDLVPAEFDLVWQMSPRGETIYSHPETGFNGAADSAISFWLAQENEVLPYHEPELVWDAQLNSAITGASHGDSSAEPSLERHSDRNLTADSVQIASHGLMQSLSVSQIEKFRDCPYILLAQKFFRQEDNPVYDLEVDRRTSGTLTHALFEFIVKHNNLSQITDPQIFNELDRLQENSELKFLEPSLWKALKNKLFKKAKEFIRAEDDYRRNFPSVKKFHLEKEFSIFWNFEKKMFSAQPDPNMHSINIKGRIDRIDEDAEGNLLLIDYKNTNNGFRNWNKWLDDNQVQLLIYMLAIQDSAIQEFSGQRVVAAFYYIVKNLSRTIGLKRVDIPQGLFLVDKAKSGISESTYQELMDEMRNILHQVLTGITEGHFPAKPRQQKDCVECRWRTQCRASHLI